MKCFSPERRPRLRRSGQSIVSRWEKAAAALSPRQLQKEFFGIVNGTAADRFGWLTPVKSREFAGVQK